jgi:single-strand DNA-binding protein
LSFAKVILSGEVVQEPEKRFTPNDHVVCSFNMMVPDPGSLSGKQNEPFLVKVTCWRNLAEAASEQLNKGDAILVEGKLIINSFQTPEGVQKKLFEIDAANLEKLSALPGRVVVATDEAQTSSRKTNAEVSSSASIQHSGTSPAAVGSSVSGAPAGGQFSSEDLLTEDDIPF